MPNDTVEKSDLTAASLAAKAAYMTPSEASAFMEAYGYTQIKSTTNGAGVSGETKSGFQAYAWLKTGNGIDAEHNLGIEINTIVIGVRGTSTAANWNLNSFIVAGDMPDPASIKAPTSRGDRFENQWNWYNADVAAATSAKNQVSDGLQFLIDTSATAKNKFKEMGLGDLSQDSLGSRMTISGQSLGGFYTDMGAKLFGMNGIKFNGVGGNSILSSQSFSSFVQTNFNQSFNFDANNNIVLPTSGVVNSVRFTGSSWSLGLGSDLVGRLIGTDIEKTNVFNITTDRSSSSSFELIAGAGLTVLSSSLSGPYSPITAVIGALIGVHNIGFTAHGIGRLTTSIVNGTYKISTVSSIPTPAKTIELNSIPNAIFKLDSDVNSTFNHGLLSKSDYGTYNSAATSFLLGNSLTGSSNGLSLKVPLTITFGGTEVNLGGGSGSIIGAFYEVVTPVAGGVGAGSIAARTPVVLSSGSQTMTVAQLAALDVNGDGKLAGNEVSGLNFWVDANENGLAESGEITAVSASKTIASDQYKILTSGNGRFADTSASPAPAGLGSLVRTVPNSNYASLRNSSQVFNFVKNGAWGSFTAQANDPYLVSNGGGAPTTIVGNNTGDNFWSGIYSGYANYFSSDSIVTLIGGNGSAILYGDFCEQNHGSDQDNHFVKYRIAA